MQVITLALKNIVLLQAQLNVQVACRAAIGSRFSIAGTADTHATIDTGWNFDFQGFLLFQLALSLARTAGFGNDLAVAAAGGARLLHTEKKP